jgi:energy-coupling factor transporter ATP-binding protein EcfA2
MTSDDALRMLRLIASEMNTEITDRTPSLAGKLPLWGARVQASIPPIVEAPVFALRKPARVVFTLGDYVNRGILTDRMAALLSQAVLDRRNILVGGGTGSGKTTLANALLQVVASTSDRVYLVEDNAELQCAAENKVQVLVQPPVYTWQRAIMDAMRFRPDRIIVGEVRDGSAAFSGARECHVVPAQGRSAGVWLGVWLDDEQDENVLATISVDVVLTFVTSVVAVLRAAIRLRCVQDGLLEKAAPAAAISNDTQVVGWGVVHDRTAVNWALLPASRALAHDSGKKEGQCPYHVGCSQITTATSSCRRPLLSLTRSTSAAVAVSTVPSSVHEVRRDRGAYLKSPSVPTSRRPTIGTGPKGIGAATPVPSSGLRTCRSVRSMARAIDTSQAPESPTLAPNTCPSAISATTAVEVPPWPAVRISESTMRR